MAFRFLIDSASFWFCSMLYWGLAAIGWIELALDGELTRPMLRRTCAMLAVVYFAGVLLVAMILEAFV